MSLLQQLIEFFAGLFRLINDGRLLQAGKDKQKLQEAEEVQSNVEKANRIADASDNRTDGFLLRDKDGE